MYYLVEKRVSYSHNLRSDAAYQNTIAMHVGGLWAGFLIPRLTKFLKIQKQNVTR